MGTVVSDLLAKLEEQKADWLEHLEGWLPDQLKYRRTAADWSALEVLDHIVKTEFEILAAARVGVSKPHRIGATDKMRTLLLFKLFRTDRRVKVPASVRQVLPEADLDLAMICQRWTTSRAALSAFVSRSGSEPLSQGIFKHPVGGWMGMAQILGFFSVHLVHHRYQLQRIAHSAALKQI